MQAGEVVIFQAYLQRDNFAGYKAHPAQVKNLHRQTGD